MSEKEEQKTRQLVQTCVVFRASIGGKKKKENQAKKHGGVFLGFHWWKKHAKSNQSSSWWFQPIWKILVKWLPQVWVKIKNIWNDHLDGGFFLRRTRFLPFSEKKILYLKLRTYWKNVQKMLEKHPKRTEDHVADQCIRSADDADVFLNRRTSRNGMTCHSWVRLPYPDQGVKVQSLAFCSTWVPKFSALRISWTPKTRHSKG